VRLVRLPPRPGRDEPEPRDPPRRLPRHGGAERLREDDPPPGDPRDPPAALREGSLPGRPTTVRLRPTAGRDRSDLSVHRRGRGYDGGPDLGIPVPADEVPERPRAGARRAPRGERRRPEGQALPRPL